MDINKLMYALDNEDNESIINLSTKSIKEMNLKILKELHLEPNVTLDYMKKLKGYKYVDELDELKCGRFIRWIPITNPEYLPFASINLPSLGNACNICSIIASLKLFPSISKNKPFICFLRKYANIGLESRETG